MDIEKITCVETVVPEHNPPPERQVPVRRGPACVPCLGRGTLLWDGGNGGQPYLAWGALHP